MLTTQAFTFFQGRGVVDETVYPYLSGGLLNPYEGLKARRNERELRTSRIFLKGLVWLLTGRVRWAYLADGKLYAEVQGSSGAYTAVALSDANLIGDPAARLMLYVPNASVNYYGAVLLAINAARLGAPDFLAALKPLVTLVQSEGLVGSEREKRALTLAADELYFAAAYGPSGEVSLALSRFNDLTVLDVADLPTPTGARSYVDLSVFNPFMRIPAVKPAEQEGDAGRPLVVAAERPATMPGITDLPAQSFRAIRTFEAFGPLPGSAERIDDKRVTESSELKVGPTALGVPMLGAERTWYKVGAHQVAVLAVKSQQADLRERQQGQALLYVVLNPERDGFATEMMACDTAERFFEELDAEQAERILEALEPHVKDCQGKVEAIPLTADSYLVWVRWVGKHIFDDMINDRINAKIAAGTW